MEYKGKSEQEGAIRRKAFLDYLIELAEETEHFTRQEIRDEVATFIVAVSVPNFFFLNKLSIRSQGKSYNCRQQRFCFNDVRHASGDPKQSV